MNHDSRDAHLLSGAYVLHALDPEERAAVEAAMDGSEELRGEIAELSDTAVELGLATRAIVPPTALRARVLALTDAPQLAPEPPVRSVRRPAGPATERAQRRWFLRPTVLVAAAAAAAVLFAGGLGVDRIVNPPATSTSQLAELISASDAQRGQADVAGGGTATVYSSVALAESAVVLDHVAPPASGHVLQLWRLRGITATSLGVYPADGSGYALLHGAIASGDRVAVTVEPAGGSAQPTTRPLVAVSA